MAVPRPARLLYSKGMRSTMPTTLTLPPFRGAVRRIVLVNLAVFFGLAILSFASPPLQHTLLDALTLSPLRVLHGFVWQPFTYSFINGGILSTAFGLLTLWFAGAMLEDTRGSRWFTELFYVSAIGGGILATLLALLPALSGGNIRFFTLVPFSVTNGIFSPLFGVLVAFGMLFADVEIALMFVLRMKVKYLVAIYVLIDLARLILGKDAFSAAAEICCGLFAFLYVRYAASRGFGFSVAERYFGARNDFYRWKRRRAARKFEVYMRKQNREVHFDNEGRYISPEDERKADRKAERRNPSDKRWMN